MLACRIKQQLQPPGFSSVYTYRTRLPMTPLTKARNATAAQDDSLGVLYPHRSALDGLMHGSMTIRAGLEYAFMISLETTSHMIRLLSTLLFQC